MVPGRGLPSASRMYPLRMSVVSSPRPQQLRLKPMTAHAASAVIPVAMTAFFIVMFV